MKNIVTNTFFLVLFATLSTGIFFQVYATGNNEKVTICHSTASQTNPYVRIVVDKNSDNGHFNANGTPKSGHQNDILLEGDRDYCPTVQTPPCPTETSGHENLTGSVDLQGNGTITNHSNTCTYEVGLASYRMLDGNIDNQLLFDSETTTIMPGQTLNLRVDLPSCAYQIDLFKGEVIQLFAGGTRYGSRLIAGNQIVNPPVFCTNVTISQTPTPYTPPALTPASAPQPSGGPAGQVLSALTTLPATGADLPLQVAGQFGLLSIGIILRKLGR